MHNDLIISKNGKWFILQGAEDSVRDLYAILLSEEGVEIESTAGLAKMRQMLLEFGWQIESSKSFAA